MKNIKSERAKKSLLVLAIAFMMALVVGMGAFTYSKYISSVAVPEQKATAAQWGFVVTANADNLFGTDYTLDTTDPNNTLATVDSNGVAVKATATAGDVVAPGTTGSMTIYIDGKAEVLSKLSVSVKEGATDLFLVDSVTSTTYYPIKWTLSDASSDIKADTTLSGALAALQSDILTVKDSEGATVSTNGVVPIGTVLSKHYTLSWEWPFESGNDDKDSKLGYLAAHGFTYDETYASTTISFEFTVSVEQIQTKTTTP